jgi:hypothetical protein
MICCSEFGCCSQMRQVALATVFTHAHMHADTQTHPYNFYVSFSSQEFTRDGGGGDHANTIAARPCVVISKRARERERETTRDSLISEREKT